MLRSIIFLSLCAFPLSLRAQSFQAIGSVTAPNGYMEVNAVSADGSVLTGRRDFEDGTRRAFRWEAGTLTILPSETTFANSGGYGISRDGRHIVGFSNPTVGSLSRAARWSENGVFSLGFLPTDPSRTPSSSASAVSEDGTVVVGVSSSGTTSEAFRYEGSMTGIGALPGSESIVTTGVSADGSVVVGSSSQRYSGGLLSRAFRWENGTMVELGLLPGTDPNLEISTAHAVSDDGTVVVGGATRNQTQRKVAVRWVAGVIDSVAAGVATAVSPDGSVIGGSPSVGGFGPDNEPWLWTEASGARELRTILLEDSGIDIGAWRLGVPTGIADDGRVIVIVGTGVNPEGRRQGWRMEVEPAGASISAPAREIVKPGEPYTVRFDADGATAINLFLVQNSRSHTGARTLIAEDIPTASGTYVWEVPEDLLSPSTFLIAVDAADPATEFRSERFRVREPWQLYRVAGTLTSPEYEPFEATRHVWGFAQQSSVLWPRDYWDREENDYDDGFDPFYAVPSDAIGGKVEYDYSIQNWVNRRILSDDAGQRIEFNRFLHPQWRVFLDAFGPDFVYVSPEPREVFRTARGAVYQSNPNPSAFAVWKEAANSPTLSVENGTYEGACFGYALTVLGAFGDPERFQSRFPALGAVRELGSTALSDAARDAIHSAHQYQYSNDNELEALRRDGTLIGSGPETPRDVLQEVKTMLALDTRDNDVILSFSGRYRADDGAVKTGAHAVAPFRLERITDEGVFKLYVIDPNRGPDEALYIRLDSLANTWSFQDGTLEWVGTNTTGLYSSLDVRLLYDRASPPQFGKLAPSVASRRGGPEVDLMRVAVTGATQQLEGTGGAIVFDGSTYTDGLDGVLGRFEETGGPSAPFAFLAEPGAYTLRLGSPDGSPVRAQATHGGRSVAYDRATEAGGIADQIQLASADRLSVQMSGGTGSLAQLDAWAVVGDTYRTYSATGIDASRAGAASVDANEDDVLGLTCQGGCDYDLSIESVTGATRRSFYHGDVPLAAGATHTVRPDWATLGDSPVTVDVDTDGDGTTDEMMTLEPQPFPVAAEPALLAPEALAVRAFPNPAFGAATVEVQTPEASASVRVTVHDALGREVAVLQDGPLAAGTHTFSLETAGLAPGLYHVRLTTKDGTSMRRVTVAR